MMWSRCISTGEECWESKKNRADCFLQRQKRHLMYTKVSESLEFAGEPDLTK